MKKNNNFETIYSKIYLGNDYKSMQAKISIQYDTTMFLEEEIADLLTRASSILGKKIADKMNNRVEQ